MYSMYDMVLDEKGRADAGQGWPCPSASTIKRASLLRRICDTRESLERPDVSMVRTRYLTTTGAYLVVEYLVQYLILGT